MKVYRHKVEAELRAVHNKVKTVSAGSYKIDGKISLNTALRDQTLKGAITLLTQEFERAAEQFEVDVKHVIIEKIGYSGERSHLTATRLETEEEREARLQSKVDHEVSNRRRLHQNKKNAAYNKKREIKRLKAELEQLEK
jgi:hypothetical protein